MTIQEMTIFKMPISVLKLEGGEIKSLGFFEPNEYNAISDNISKSEVRDYYEAENDYEGRYYEAWI